MMPGLRLSLAITANRAAKETMQFPTNSRRIANHLHKHKFKYKQEIFTKMEMERKIEMKFWAGDLSLNSIGPN